METAKNKRPEEIIIGNNSLDASVDRDIWEIMERKYIFGTGLTNGALCEWINLTHYHILFVYNIGGTRLFGTVMPNTALSIIEAIIKSAGTPLICE